MIQITLPREFVGQMLDGLEVLIEQWSYTAEYLETGLVRDDICSRECADPEEARSIADYYQQVLDEIQRQYQDA
jgi:hypothetical protein